MQSLRPFCPRGPTQSLLLKLAFKLKLAVDKGNAAALVSFLVLDAITDTKIRKHEPDGLTMDADTNLHFFGQRPAFFGQPMG